jgi:hypothetical protein
MTHAVGLYRKRVDSIGTLVGIALSVGSLWLLLQTYWEAWRFHDWTIYVVLLAVLIGGVCGSASARLLRHYLPVVDCPDGEPCEINTPDLIPLPLAGASLPVIDTALEQATGLDKLRALNPPTPAQFAQGDSVSPVARRSASTVHGYRRNRARVPAALS